MSVEAIIEPSDYVAPDTFNQFLADLKARARQTKSPIISPRMFCLALGMDVQTLASRAHVHRVTVNRAQGAEKLQTYLRDAVRVMGAAADINGIFRMPRSGFVMNRSAHSISGHQSSWSARDELRIY